MKKIVVAGAGYAGVLAAKKIAKQKIDDVEISIIDKNPFHTMLTELHEVAAWRVEEDSIRISLDKVFAGRKVNIVHDNVTGIDFEAREVKGEHGVSPYDYLVIATGSKPAFFGVPGAKEHTFTLWSYDDAVKLREHIMVMFREASAEPDVAKKRELLTFVTVGAGFTGVEMAGELAELVPTLCERFEIDRSLVSQYDVDMMDRVCTVLPEKLSKKVQRRLEKTKVNVMLKTNIKAVGENYIEYDAGQGLKKIPARTVIWTAGIEGSDASYASKEAGEAERGRGRVKTDEYLRSANYKNVYVAGDNVFYVPEGAKEPVPQMVENAEQSAHTVAHNIVTDITGKGEKEKYSPKFHGVMVCVGGRWGTAHVGTEKTKFALPSFFAMFTKHFVNILYFIQVLGWNKIFGYLKHEFFTVRNKRSFVGGHFSNRSLSVMGVLLRVFLGFYFLVEGIMKINQGWYTEPKVADSMYYANAWYESQINPKPASTGSTGSTDANASATGETAAAEPAADATASATGDTAATETTADATASATGESSGTSAVTTTGPAKSNVIVNWNILWVANPILVGASELKDVAFKVSIRPVNWIMEQTLHVSKSPSERKYMGHTAEMVMQIVIVTLEILLGLALMGGLFTTLAAAGTIVLQMMFLTSTGLYASSWWMIPGAIACMFSAGTVFSFDYYVMPWLKKLWKKTKIARKWYIYND